MQKIYDPEQPNFIRLGEDDKDILIAELKKQNERLETQLSQTNQDFQDFMTFFFENNPALA